MAIRMIAVDLDGTLLGADGRCGARNLAALKAAEDAGIHVAVATGRRHCYALHVLRELGLREETILVSSNGAVVRNFDSTLIERTLMDTATAEWLCGHLDEFRNALVVTFDRVGPDGEDARGALVIEEFEDLQASIPHWMRNNERYIAQVRPIEDSLRGPHAQDAPIQMMLCGTVERMRRAEAHMAGHPNVAGVGAIKDGVQITLSRTEYPARDLSIVDILPAGCSKGAALVRLAEARGFGADQIMAIGDNWNDLSMLEVAGFPVLMGNAPADLKAMAEERGWLKTCANDADGVAEAIFAAIPDLEAAALTLAGDAGSK
jgi:hydroxymethylpyrimidine pyrophosphatase-like HAD family hydrolase